MHDIEDLHQIAVKNQRKTYTDPNTGFTVFTEYAHLKRGRCCGNSCRHCPYKTKVRSGDKKGIQKILLTIENSTDENVFETNNCCDDDESVLSDESSTSSSSCSSSTISLEQDDALREKGHNAPTTKFDDKYPIKTTKNVPYTRNGDGGSSQVRRLGNTLF